MKTPNDFATSPAMFALNTLTAAAMIAGAVNAVATNADATEAASSSLAPITDASDSIMNYDTAAQQSLTPQFGQTTYLTTNTTSGIAIGGAPVDDTKTTQD